MGHQLVPRTGMQMPASEVARRLSAEFAHVVVDEDRGLSRALEAAEWIERANPSVFLGHHNEALAHARQLRSLAPGEALWIEFGDDARLVASLVVWLQEPIKFGYSGDEEEREVRPLVERCAKALDSDVVKF